MSKGKIKKYKQVILSIAMLLVGLLVGLLLKSFCPADVCDFLDTNIFSSASTLFLNAIKMIVVPLVFCTIMQSFSGFKDLKQFGKIGITIFIMFIALSIFAIFLGYVSYHICPIGDPGLASIIEDSDIAKKATSTANKVNVEDLTPLNMLLGVIPSNIFQAFTEANMLQIIFVAILFGIATMLLGNVGKTINNALDIITKLLMKVTGLIIKLMPIVIFCCMASITISAELSELVSITQWVGLIYATDIVMIIIYCILILFIVRVNPLTFLGRISPAMITGFTLCSSTAAMPVSMECANKELGLDKTIYSLGIPLGTTINMNGSCITQTISLFFMAQIFGLDISTSVFITIAFTILLLAIGAPGIPGGALVCISVLLPIAGMPAEGIAIIMGVYPLVSMMQTCANLTGDIVVSTITAKIFGMIDMTKWNKKPKLKK